MHATSLRWDVHWAAPWLPRGPTLPRPVTRLPIRFRARPGALLGVPFTALVPRERVPPAVVVAPAGQRTHFLAIGLMTCQAAHAPCQAAVAGAGR